MRWASRKSKDILKRFSSARTMMKKHPALAIKTTVALFRVGTTQKLGFADTERKYYFKLLFWLYTRPYMFFTTITRPSTTTSLFNLTWSTIRQHVYLLVFVTFWEVYFIVFFVFGPQAIRFSVSVLPGSRRYLIEARVKISKKIMTISFCLTSFLTNRLPQLWVAQEVASAVFPFTNISV